MSLFALKKNSIMRAKPKARTLRTNAAKRSLDTHLLNYMAVYALIGFACLYLVEWAIMEVWK